MSNNEDQKAKLLQAKKDLYNLGAVNSKIDEVSRLREESATRLRQMREARNYYGRYERSQSPRDPTPDVSDLSHSPESSNESSVDPWTVAEHKRPSTIPREFKGKHPEDRAELVQDLSEREDDPSNVDGFSESRDGSTARRRRKKAKVSEMTLDGPRGKERGENSNRNKHPGEGKKGDKRKFEV